MKNYHSSNSASCSLRVVEAADRNQFRSPIKAAKGQHLIAMAGNPNCGKSTIFNLLTGSRQRIGNYPGVTVEKTATGNKTTTLSICPELTA